MDSPRRSSVFSDLLTVFRKNTVSSRRRSIYHAPPCTRPSVEYRIDDLVESKEADALGDGEENDEDEDEEKRSGKPMTRQSLLNKIRQKKEVINKLRCQPWSMNRKRRTLRLAQKYLEQNESKVSRAHLYKEELIKRWRLFLRWASNISIYLIPWESKIKKIESQFGSVVSSYFTFLRWVIFMNFIITLLITSLIIIPEFLSDATADEMRRNRTNTRKEVPIDEKSKADEFQVILHYGGYLRYSPLFYGYYANMDFVVDWFRYPIPLAYFLGTLIVFGCSFIAILRKMAFNARMSKLAGSKAEQYIFNWKVFTGWDYTIGNAETASNTAMAAVIKLRETINECHAEQSKRIKPVQVIIRIFTNIVILGMIAFSIYCIYAAVQSSETVDETGSGSLLNKNQVPSVVSTITHVFPIIFDLIGRIEKHHPKMQLRLHLIRVLTLYVINYATLIFALFEKLDSIRDSTRTFEDDEQAYYTTIKHHHATVPQRNRRGATTTYFTKKASPFLSKNFSSETQLNDFLSKNVTAFTEAPISSTTLINSNINGTTQLLHKALFSTSTSSSIQRIDSLSSSKASATTVILNSKRKKRQSSTEFRHESQLSSLSSGWRPTIPPMATEEAARRKAVTVDGTTVTINAQFGPVSVNNPFALMRNATPPSMLTTYETRRLGPTPLPIFTPPPLPPTEAQPTFRKQDFGPDWSTTKTEKITETISFGDVVKLDTIPYSELNDERNGTSVAEISANVGDQGHYNDHICWETVIGQEIVKLVTVDLYYTIISILIIDFLRGYWIRYCSSWWCWDIETTFPEYGEFKVAENVLHIINNQGMIWLGLFFAPLLPAINNVKLIIIMYIRAWACMTCNVPAREIFRASRSSNFFLMILLLWLLLCTLPVGYVITSKRPSTTCGPFAGREQFYEVITEIIEAHVSKKVLRWLKYVASPGVIIPIILLLMLVIFFLVSLVRGLREANTDLQKQLVHERTEEKKKIFELAGGGNKKKTSASLFGITFKSHQKKPAQHLPEVEQKRREPWRQYNGTDRASSLCPSDEALSSLNSPLSESVGPLKRPANVKPRDSQQEMISMTDISSRYQQRTSVGFVHGVCERRTDSKTENAKMKMSKSVSLARSNAPTDRVDDCWYNENESHHSEDSFEASNAIPRPQLNTPDELRLHQLCAAAHPLATLHVGRSDSSGTSMSRSGTFPSGNCSQADNNSALTQSFSYQHGSDLPLTQSLAAAELLPGITPAQKVPQRISIYSKEPRRLGQMTIKQTALSGARINTSVNVHPQGAPARSSSPTKTKSELKCLDVEKPKSGKPTTPTSSVSSHRTEVLQNKPPVPPQTSNKKFTTNELTDQFMPWPSIEEVKAQRSQLYPTTTKPSSDTSSRKSSTSHHYFRSRSPPKKVIHPESEKPGPSTDESKDQQQQPTRFRISVSPTRKLRAGLNASSSEGSSSEDDHDHHHTAIRAQQQKRQKRYIIKQQLMPGSTSSFGSRMSSETAAVRAELAASKQLAAQSGQAPRVEFGEDDSPRVEIPPKFR